MDSEKLEPFYKHWVSIPAVQNNLLSQSLSKADFNTNKCLIFKRILKNKNIDQFMNKRGFHRHEQTMQFHDEATRNHSSYLSNNVYRVASTAAFASARVESLFSALTKIDATQWRSMDTEREADLTFLFYEKDTLIVHKFEDFLKIRQAQAKKNWFYGKA